MYHHIPLFLTPLLSGTLEYLVYIVNIIAADDLVMQGSRALEAMLLT